jgi:hypothetical protein
MGTFVTHCALSNGDKICRKIIKKLSWIMVFLFFKFEANYRIDYRVAIEW